MKKLLFLSLLAVTAALPFTAHADWDAGRDLIRNEKPDGGAQETGNPNATVPQWSYGYRTGIENTALTVFTAAEHSNHFGGAYEGLEGFASANVYGVAVYPGGTPFTVGNQDPLAANEIFTSIDDHSGSTNTVIRWTCPAAGTYTYKVKWHDLDPGGGDGAAGYVVINGVKAFGASWPNGRGQGANTTATVNLSAGAVIDVLLNANSSDSSYDTAGISFTVISGTPQCAAAPSGLVARYAAEGNANDSAGTSNGALQGNVTYATGKVGQAFSFGGDQSAVAVGNPTQLQLQNLTIEAWIKRSSATQITTDPSHTEAAQLFACSTGGYNFFIYSDGHLAFGKTDVTVANFPDLKITDTNFHHVAVTKSGTNVVAYLDGTASSTNTLSEQFTFTNNSAYIGAYRSDYFGERLNYSFYGAIDELSIYNRALSTTEIQSIVNAGSAGKCSGPAVPAHGGLSETTFQLNESTNPPSFVNDTVLRFRAVQSGRPAGLKVKVQSSLDYSVSNAANAHWTDLPDATGGQMSYVAQFGGYSLNSTNYPTENGVFFRAVASGPGYQPESDSNVVGPCNLTRVKPHLGGPLLLVSTNDSLDSIYFSAKQTDRPSGLAVRIQASQTPADESSWTDATNIGPDGGYMKPDAGDANRPPDPNHFYVGTDTYPNSSGIYFRTVASAPGYTDALSFAYGPFSFIVDPPATVAISLNGIDFKDGTDFDDPAFVSTGSFSMTADATSGRFLKKMILLYDAIEIGQAADGATHAAVNDYRTNVPGDHVIEAIATDDLYVSGSARVVHVRVLPSDLSHVYQMTQSGNWNDPANWQNFQGQSGIPGAKDFAILGPYSAVLRNDVTVNAISMNGGTLSGPNPNGGLYTLTASSFCTIGGGNIASNLTIPSGSTCELLNDTDIGLSGKLSYSGTVRMHGKGGINKIRTGASTSSAAVGLDNANPDFSLGDIGGAIVGTLNAAGNGLKAAAQFLISPFSGGNHGSSKASPPPQPAPRPPVPVIAVASIETAVPIKVVQLPKPEPVISNDGGSLQTLDNAKLISQDGGGLISQDGGGLISQDGGGIVSHDSGGIISHDSGGVQPPATGGSLTVATSAEIVSHDSGGIISHDSGGFTPPAGANIVVTPNVNSSSRAHADSAPAAFVITGGETDLSGLTINAPVILNGGILSGSGIILGDLTNNGGYITPGHSAGAIAVLGNFSQGTGGTMILEDGGPNPLQFDQLHLSGAATLAGNLIVNTINGYIPDAADTFNPIGYSSVSGSFASISGNAQLTFNANGAIAAVNPSIPNVPAAKLLNIATRLAIQQGDNALFAGLIVTGPAGSSKKVIIRGLGPSLAVGSPIADPLLVLNNPDGSKVVNDNWRDGDTSQIPTGFSPSNEKESVIVAILTVGSAGYGSYTVVMKGAHDEIGVGLVEVYDLDTNSAAQLANIATRGVVQTGDNVLIGGFIVGGAEPAKVLVRATGPSSGITGALQDPVLEIHDSNGGAISNDNWRESQESEISATGIPPRDDREPAIVATLVPGGYTAVVRGSNDSTGIAIVEAYSLQ